MQKDDNYYSKLFFYGAIWNYSISIGILFLLSLSLDIWDLFEVSEPISKVWLIGFLLYVGYFGIGFHEVSKNLDKNHGVVRLGIIEKVGAFILLLIHLILGELGVLVFLIAVGDFIWAILFKIQFMMYLRVVDYM